MYYQEPIHLETIHERIVIEGGVNVVIHDYADADRDVHIHENAHIQYFIVPKNNTVHATVNFYLHRAASIEIFLLCTRQATIKLITYLLQENAQVAIKGACLLSSSHTANITTQQEHRARATSSSVILKAALQDKATMVYDGTITIEKKASQCTASQYNKNILLSNTAHAQSVPSLQVLNNDVKCSHGSAASYLDKDQLFYVYSRGLSEKQAQQLLLQGFFAEIIDQLPQNMVSDIQNHITQCVIK